MDAFRRHKLRQLIATEFGDSRERFMVRTGYSKSRLSQLLNDKYPFGEKAARELALAAGLDENYFENMDPRTAQWAIRFNELPEHVKQSWESLVGMLTQADSKKP